MWYHSGIPPVPIRWLVVRDPSGELDPQAFLATDLIAKAQDILAWFVSRWQVEVTFEEVRAHLGVETQRQWTDKAILRTTPTLLALFSIVTLCRTISHKRKNSNREPQHGIQSQYLPSAMPLLPCAEKSGIINFLHVPAAPRQHRNSAAYLAPRRKRSRLRRLNRPK
jgi:hypothetical protein